MNTSSNHVSNISYHNNLRKKALLVRGLVLFNIFISAVMGLWATPRLMPYLPQFPVLISMYYFFIFWIISSNIAMFCSKEAGRRIFLVFLWLTVLMLNFFLIFQTAPFFMDPITETTRTTTFFLYICVLLPCAFEIIFLTRPDIIKSFQNK